MHAKTLSMEFGDNRVQFNIFEAMKHPTEDHSLFGIDIIEEPVEDYMQPGISLVEISNFVETTHVLDTSDSMTDDSNSVNMTNAPDYTDSVDDFSNVANMIDISNFSDLADLECRCDGDTKCSICAEIQTKAEFASRRSLPHLDNQNQTRLVETRTDQLSLQSASKPSPPPSPPLPVIIANNLQSEQEEKLLQVLTKHKKAIGPRNQPFHFYAQNIIGGRSPTNKAAIEVTKSHHPRCRQEGGHETTCSRDHLPNIRQPVG
ncbi:hypothetical protein CR513_02962, partial [Mucuna pruriens]